MEHMGHKTIDPVCGMEVNPETAPAKTEHQGKTYYFCAPGCKNAFEENPEQYIHGEHGEHHHE